MSRLAPLLVLTSACAQQQVAGTLTNDVGGTDTPFFESAYWVRTASSSDGRATFRISLWSVPDMCDAITSIETEAQTAGTTSPEAYAAAWQARVPAQAWQLDLTVRLQLGTGTLDGPQVQVRTDDAFNAANAQLNGWYEQPTSAFFAGNAPISDFAWPWQGIGGDLVLVRDGALGDIDGMLQAGFERQAGTAHQDAIAIGFTAAHCPSYEEILVGDIQF